jgi:hypothetical protein
MKLERSGHAGRAELETEITLDVPLLRSDTLWHRLLGRPASESGRFELATSSLGRRPKNNG